MQFRTTTIISCALTLLLASGCMTAPNPVSGRTAFVRLASSHSAIVQGSRTLPSRAGSVLKRAGATPGTNIEIALVGNAGPGAVNAVRRSAMRAGYRNVFVVADVKVSADGMISILGKPTQLTELGPRLTGMGAGRNTLLRVNFARNVSPATIRSVMQAMIRAGFPKVVTARKMAPTVSIQKK